MNSNDLTTDQAQKLYNAIYPTLGYLNRVLERMDRERFPADDNLRLLTVQACDALHSLAVTTHYLSCASGVCRSRPQER